MSKLQDALYRRLPQILSALERAEELQLLKNKVKVWEADNKALELALKKVRAESEARVKKLRGALRQCITEMIKGQHQMSLFSYFEAHEHAEEVLKEGERS